MEGLGKPVTLSNGNLEFTAWVSDEAGGAWVVLLHGFPDGPETWQYQVPALVSSGYKVAVVTSRGYEPSSQPASDDYQVTSLADDFPVWLNSLGAPSAHLIGHDWGATIAYAVAAKYPDLVLSLSCLAVPHPGRLAEVMARDLGQVWRSRYIIGFQIAGLAEYRIRRRNFNYIGRLWRRWSPGWVPPAETLQAVKSRFVQPGVLEATLSYYRQGADTKTELGKASRVLAKSKIGVPTLGLSGERDNCISSKVFAEAMKPSDFPAGLSIECVAEAGHFLHLEQPQRVNEILSSWLAGR